MISYPESSVNNNLPFNNPITPGSTGASMFAAEDSSQNTGLQLEPPKTDASIKNFF